MSGGYADRLKAYPNKGVCGLPEKYDNERRLAASLREVVNAVREAQHLVIFTGAGISTAAGIPDFRGPTGIWTQEKARDKAAREASKRRREEEADAAAAAEARDAPGVPVRKHDAPAMALLCNVTMQHGRRTVSVHSIVEILNETHGPVEVRGRRTRPPCALALPSP